MAIWASETRADPLAHLVPDWQGNIAQTACGARVLVVRWWARRPDVPLCPQCAGV